MTEARDGAAVFLDRDGVINRRRVDHVKSWSEFEFLPGTLEALAALRRAGARVVVVTNQAVVGRGVVREEDLAFIHTRMAEAVAMAGGWIERTYVCVHTPDAGCPCRKPGTALLEQARAELGIKLELSLLVGDAPTDVEAARAAGCVPVLMAENGEGGHGDGVTIVHQLSDVLALFAQVRSRQVVPC
ncbi:MAG TPA: HAD-IIIA family hydrolase [Chloroflexota bacterium]